MFLSIPTCLDTTRASTSKQTNVCIEQELKIQQPQVSLDEEAQKNVNQNYCRMTMNSIFFSSVVFGLFLSLIMNVLFEFQSSWSGSSHDSVQPRRVVISHNMDKALKEGKS